MQTQLIENNNKKLSFTNENFPILSNKSSENLIYLIKECCYNSFCC